MKRSTIDLLINIAGIGIIFFMIALYEMNYRAVGTWGLIVGGFFAPRFIFVAFRLFMMWREGRMETMMEMATAQFRVIKHNRGKKK